MSEEAVTADYQPGERLSPEHAAATAVLIPQQMDLALFQDNCAHSDPRQVAIFAHGEFPDEDPIKQLIFGSWIDRHTAAWRERSTLPTGLPVTCFGLDVARSLSGDNSVLTAGGIEGLREQCATALDDLTKVVAWAKRTAIERYGIDLVKGRNPICVDCDGLGAGAADMLRADGCWVMDFRGNATSQVDPRTYANLRTEAYGELAARLNPKGRWAAMPFALPDFAWLHEELCAPEKVHKDNDMIRFGLIPKRKQENGPSVEEKIGRSPDFGDSAVYCFTAIRLYHQIDEIIASYRGPLTCWPPAGGAAAVDMPVVPNRWDSSIEPGTKEEETLRHPIRDWRPAGQSNGSSGGSQGTNIPPGPGSGGKAPASSSDAPQPSEDLTSWIKTHYGRL